MRISDWSSDVCSSDLGLGIGLANLVAKINGAPNGYRLAATGDTDYGPLSADVVLLMTAGPLTIDVERGDLAGIGFNGRLVQSEAGPFTGQLNASGQRSEEHTSELQSLMRISYAVFCLKKKK